MIDSASDILSAWQNQQPTFELWTSGSTGDPNSVSHSRESLTWSANSTLQSWFNPEKPPIQLCALPLNKAGGFMQVIRAAVWQTSLWELPPQTNPLLHLDQATFFLFNPKTLGFEMQRYTANLWEQHKPTTVSLTPMQLSVIMGDANTKKLLTDFEVVLLGGQALSGEVESRLISDFPKTRFIHTFGSTETASHFAGREIIPGNSDYCIAPDTQISTNEKGEIQVCNPTTKNQWITLHDRIEITAPNRFRWLERSNLYINTGGIKIAIEPLENRIAALLNWPQFSFYIVGKPHPTYGEQITLFTTHTTPIEIIQQGLSALTKMEQPKEILYIAEIPTLHNGKIYRNPNP
ncbi:MAG: AMP-binding protein [Bacteroidota bacterium]